MATLGSPAGELLEVVGVVCGHDAAAEPDGRGDDQRVDRYRAACIDTCQQVPSDRAMRAR